MNKHVVAFLSVFSLGLVLSVYYVFIPKGNNSKPVNASVTTPVDYQKVYFQGLERKREENHKKNIDTYNASLANCNDQEKEYYVNLIETEQKNMINEVKIDKKITEIGYSYAVSYINTDEVVVNYSSKPNNDEVELMYLVLGELNDDSVKVVLLKK